MILSRVLNVTLTLAGEENSLFATKFGGIMGGMKGGIELCMALFIAVLMRSTGTGKMTVLLFSAEMLLRVCKYRSCSENEIMWECLQNKLYRGWWAAVVFAIDCIYI